MSRPEASAITPPKPQDAGPIFAEPWHAQVLAIADTLTRAGLFSAADWAARLGARIKDGQARGDPDNQETYYGCALAALEALIAERSPQTGSALSERVEQWRRAYLNTPHGRPVELAAGLGGAHGHAADH